MTPDERIDNLIHAHAIEQQDLDSRIQDLEKMVKVLIADREKKIKKEIEANQSFRRMN